MRTTGTANGTTLSDRYRLERELGRGGMATVHLAHDLKHQRKVAIKVIDADIAARIGVDRFLREIQTIASLQHPHILGLIDSGEVDGAPYYVMPFVTGGSLRHRLDSERQIPIADAIRLVGEVAAAVDYANRHGVVHRDIKPANILLQDGQALVADFGIALAVTDDDATRMTAAGISLGTPHYMSPEQASGNRDITPRSDVYALGALTYEMLVGEPPFTGPTAQSILAKILTEKPAGLSARRDTVPTGVERAVLTALQKLPADRYGSAGEFSLALSSGLAPTRRQAPRSRSTPRRGRRRIGSRRTPAGVCRGRRSIHGWLAARCRTWTTACNRTSWSATSRRAAAAATSTIRSCASHPTAASPRPSEASSRPPSGAPRSRSTTTSSSSASSCATWCGPSSRG